MNKEQLTLFEKNTSNKPLALSSRPQNLDDFKGQEHIIKRIANIKDDYMPHIVLSGPPGCGKTTLAQILAKKFKLELHSFNAVLSGVSELRKIIKTAISTKEQTGNPCVIFIDEIHRFNKAQQDALLPHLEASDFILLGATTENPNTSLNKAILSRIQCWRLNALDEKDIKTIITNVKNDHDLDLSETILNYIAKHNNGDARAALNQLELLLQNKAKLNSLSDEEIIDKLLFSIRRYDKNSERHYDVISAFIKSIRGSDIDSALLWLAVMLDGGEDVEFIARRMIILASEDIGNADPRALQVSCNAHYAIKNIGMPEARIILAQACTYLAQAPKSNSSYLAIDKALDYVRKNPTIEVPPHLRNHHPKKKEYKYPHNYPKHWVQQSYQNENQQFFKSSLMGHESFQVDFMNKVKN